MTEWPAARPLHRGGRRALRGLRRRGLRGRVHGVRRRGGRRLHGARPYYTPLLLW
jgi:hypothetical protein